MLAHALRRCAVLTRRAIGVLARSSGGFFSTRRLKRLGLLPIVVMSPRLFAPSHRRASPRPRGSRPRNRPRNARGARDARGLAVLAAAAEEGRWEMWVNRHYFSYRPLSFSRARCSLAPPRAGGRMSGARRTRRAKTPRAARSRARLRPHSRAARRSLLHCAAPGSSSIHPRRARASPAGGWGQLRMRGRACRDHAREARSCGMCRRAGIEPRSPSAAPGCALKPPLWDGRGTIV